jgi:hypothetical protein
VLQMKAIAGNNLTNKYFLTDILQTALCTNLALCLYGKSCKAVVGGAASSAAACASMKMRYSVDL